MFPLPIGVLLRHYFVVAEIASNADSGNAFRVAAALGHINVSTPAQIGSPIAAANSNRVVIDGLQPRIEVTPLGLDFGAVAVGDNSAAALLVANLGAADLVIGTITTDDSRFTALPADLVISPGNNSPVAVTFTPDAGGALAANLELVHNGQDNPTQVGLTGSGTVTSTAVQITPMNVDFGNIKFGEIGQTSIDLTNESSGTITISSISSSDPQFSYDVSSATLAPGETRPVALYFTAASLGTKTATLTVQQDGTSPPIALPLRADATVALNISSLNFGSIEPGRAAFLPLTIDNPSAAPVTITSILSNNPAFIPDCTTCVIPAGGSETIHVTFTPTSVLAQSAQLSITHNPTLIVNLSANGFNRDFSQTLDADGKPLQTMAVPFGGEWLAALLVCCYALCRRRFA